MDLIPWKQRHRYGVSHHPLTLFRGEMDDLFERFFGGPWGRSLFELAPGDLDWTPHADLAESDSDFTLRLELPAVKPEDVDIQLSGNVLTVRGEKTEETEDKEKNYHSKERRFGSFMRRIQLPGDVNAEKVDATFKDGVLTITLEKIPEAKAKKINVRAK